MDKEARKEERARRDAERRAALQTSQQKAEVRRALRNLSNISQGCSKALSDLDALYKREKAFNSPDLELALKRARREIDQVALILLREGKNNR